MLEPVEVQYAQSGDLSIAYSVFGNGPLDVVFVPGFISHQELAWDSPFFRGVYERLGAIARVITFDKRGTGLSERTLGFGSAEERMDDIRAVMDAVGCERAALVGISEGGPLTMLFAATYPHRASALVLWGTFARVLADADYPIGVEAGPTEELFAMLRETWGSGQALRFFVQHGPEGPEADRELARYERNASTPAMVVEIMRRNVEIDVRSALPAISAPTLVVHQKGDPAVPVRQGRYLAEHIDGARITVLPGDWHVHGAVGGEEDTLDVIEEFLTGERPARVAEIDRILATVLFTDIVGSTEHAAELGDRKWRDVLDRFRFAVRRELDQHRGREVNTRGDDFFATFDGPGRAVRCAGAIGVAARPLGLQVRAGLHTGEVELQGDDVAGMAVHIGARVCGLAGADEVLVTSTVRDLVVGSGIEFADRGRHELKGVPGDWQVLAVQE
jgi:class 3 adenylate cyclase/alpha-beta hydrolase superfamily lysophospholipase